MTQLVEASITAQNTFSAAVRCDEEVDKDGDLAVSISGTFAATVTIQRSLDGGSTWGDETTTYTGAIEARLTRTRGVQYRVGVKTGNFTSGTVVIKIR